MRNSGTYVRIEDVDSVERRLTIDEFRRLRGSGVLDIYKKERLRQNIIMGITVVLLIVLLIIYLLIRQGIIGDNLLPDSLFEIEYTENGEKNVRNNANVVDTIVIVAIVVGIFIAFFGTYFARNKIYYISNI